MTLMRSVLSVAAFGALLAACKEKRVQQDPAVTRANTEASVKKTAEDLCALDRRGSPRWGDLPRHLRASIRLKDRSFLEEEAAKEAAEGAAHDPATSDGPATCKATGIDLRETTAVVTLSRTSIDGSVSDYVLAFVDEDAHFRADYHLLEAYQLRSNAYYLGDDFEFDAARKKLADAKKMRPYDVEIDKEIAELEARIASRVAGRWLNKSPKGPEADKSNVFLMLTATDVKPKASGPRPILTVRCVKGELDVTMSVAAETAKIDGAPIHYRFEKDAAAKPLRTTRSTDGTGVFFPEPAKWVDLLGKRSAENLVLSVAVDENGPLAITFGLAGAEQAMPLVKKACGKPPP